MLAVGCSDKCYITRGCPQNPNMEMLITTPIRPIELMLCKTIPYIFIGLLQVSIILGLGYMVFNVPINGGLWVLFCDTLLFIAASLALG